MKKFRIVGLLLVLCLISSSFVGVTFAKYTSTASGQDAATVAKWSFKAMGSEIAIATTPTLSFNLFDVINDSGNNADETDVNDNLIAPGTAGYFKIEIENSSEVTAKYTVEFTAQNNYNIPIVYTLTPTDDNSWKSSISDLNITVESLASGGTGEHIIYWRWLYDVNADRDEADTVLGIAAQNGTLQVVVTATVKATQVD